MVDLTWPQYERAASAVAGRSSNRRETLTMVKKERLLPIRYEGDTEIELDWNVVELDSIIRAVVWPSRCVMILIR